MALKTPKIGPMSTRTLRHALAEAAGRTEVDSHDLNGGRSVTHALPYQVITPALRLKRGWEAHEESEVAYRATRTPRPKAAPTS
jgi:hypothetical protein